MQNDKKIKDAFNNRSLDNEDWLSPPSAVFENIEDELFNKKKRKPFFPLWLQIGIFVMFLIGLLTYRFNTASTEIADSSNNVVVENKSDVLSNINIENEIPSSSTLQNQKQLDSNEEISVEALTVNDSKEISFNSTTESIKNTKNNNVESSKSDSKIANQSSSDKNSINQNRSISITNETNLGIEVQANFANNRKGTVSNFESTTNINVIQQENNNTNQSLSTDLNSAIFSDDINKNNIGLEKYNTSAIEQLNVIPVTLRSEDDLEQNLLANNNASYANPILLKQNDWIFTIGTSLSFWNFKLNENYQTALQPADFTYTNGKGIAIFTGVEKSFASSFRVKATVGFENINFKSGHNSSINYNPALEESNMSNDFSLTMASPLGFIESEINVRRSDGVNAEATDLVVDLNNSHKVSNFDFGMSVLKQFSISNRLALNLEGGAGLNHLISLDNDLYKFSLSKEGFQSGNSSITADQNELKKTRPYFLIGGSSMYKINPNSSIGLSYQLKQDFNSIYQSGDFNTLLKRQFLILEYRVKL